MVPRDGWTAGHTARPPLKSGKRQRDSDFGQPSSDATCPKYADAATQTATLLAEHDSVDMVPTLRDTDETLVKQIDNVTDNYTNDSVVQMSPLIMQHSVFPLLRRKDPTLVVKIIDTEIPILLDTGAHVSVLPKSVLEQLVHLPDKTYNRRPIRTFGGHEVNLDGPVAVTVTICGLKIVHSFYYVDAEIPAIGGYDLMRAAHIVIDPHAAVAWFKHPDVVNTARCQLNPGVSNGDQPTSETTESLLVASNGTPTSGATEGTSCVCTPLGAPQAVDPLPTPTLDPLAPSFVPQGRDEMTADADGRRLT